MAESNNDNSGTPNKEDVTFTPEQQEKLNTIVQERVNKLNAKITNLEESKQKDIENAVAKARTEWEEEKRLESLSGQEKLQAEYDAKMAKFKRDQDSLAKELNDARMALAISKAEAQLAALNLPTEFADKFVGENDETTSKNIQLFDAKVKELVAQKVNESIARGSPKLGNAEAQSRPDWQAEIASAMKVKG